MTAALHIPANRLKMINRFGDGGNSFFVTHADADENEHEHEVSTKKQFLPRVVVGYLDRSKERILTV